MLKGEIRFSWFSIQPYVLLLLLIFLAPAHASVTVTALTQDPINPVIEGDNPVYTLTLESALTDQVAADITVSIALNEADGSSMFSSEDCTFDARNGNFSCGQLESVTTQNYQFTWINPPVAGDYVLKFDVLCSIFGGEVACNGDSAQLATIVIAESVSVTEITLNATPGETVTETFTVVDNLSTTISTDPDIDSSVDPTTLPAGGGSVEYSITVPSTATVDEVITDTITVTDMENNISTIAVKVTVTEATTEDLNLSGLEGLTTSEREVANALDNACAELTSSELPLTDGQEALAEICTLLSESNDTTQRTAVQQMTPKQAPAQGTSSVEISQRQFDNITARMMALRSGATGISATGLTLEYGGFSLPLSLFSQASETPSGGSAGEENTSLFGKFGFFINGNLSFGDKNESSNELGFDFDTQGLTAGLDYRFTDQFIVGGAIGYVSNDTDFDAVRGNMDVDGYSLAVYSTYYHSEASYLDAIISFGWNDFDTSRRISFSSLSADATGDTDGTEYSISLGGGYDFYRNALSFGPFARINYINADIDGYIEHTISGMELVYEDQEVESLSTLLGGQLSYAISTSKGVFTPQLRLEWAHEFKNDSRFIQARFLYDPTETPFRLSTDNPDRDYFNLGAGVSATFAAGKSGYIYYEALLGHENIGQHSLAAGLRFEF